MNVNVSFRFRIVASRVVDGAGATFTVRSVLAIMLDHHHAVHTDYLAATQVESNAMTGVLLEKVTQLLSAEGLSSREQTPMALRYLSEVVSGQANALAFQDAFIILAICFAIASVGALALAGRPTTKMVTKRSLAEPMVRVAITPGIAQA